MMHLERTGMIINCARTVQEKHTFTKDTTTRSLIPVLTLAIASTDGSMRVLLNLAMSLSRLRQFSPRIWNGECSYGREITFGSGSGIGCREPVILGTPKPIAKASAHEST